MVLARTNDACVEGFSPRTRLRFLYSDVSETAARLQAQHGNCLASGAVLARALAGVALIGIDLGELDETISLNAEVNGRVGGFFVEMTGRGELRGHTYNTDFDALPPPEPDIPDPCGTVARVKLTRAHESGRVRSQMSFSVSPASEQGILEEFYNATVQIPAKVCLHAVAFENRIERARALAVQLMPDGPKSEYERIVALFADGTVAEQLEYDASVNTLREIFDLPDLTTGPTRALAFGCTCSQEVAERSYATRSKPELDGLVRTTRPQTFRCHLCGRVYTLAPEKLVEIAHAAK
ncbi:MAG: Hsp33 family molecular chaperone HslO [Kiritimatiellia bacterium]|jgi:redox-regulated HSP33 family molecular chaperone|uniref:Hsp33 family molecular chaperone HslO n=1 Tax=Atribacter sp. TaxID=2847780 RepID=UPI003D993FB1